MARRGTERRVHAVDLNGGRDCCARCAPDSPQCEDMKGYRVLGSSSSEPVRHGLLNLAAKFPALYTKAMARNGGSFAAARAMYRAGQRQEAAEQRAEKAAAAAGTVDARALLKSSFPAAFQSAEARDGGALTDRDARRVVDAEEAKRQQAAAWSPPQTQLDELPPPAAAAHQARARSQASTATRAHAKAAARTTNLAQLEEGRETLARDEARQESVAKVAAAALAKEEAAVDKARAEERRAHLAQETEEARARQAREKEAREQAKAKALARERAVRARRAHNSLAEREEHHVLAERKEQSEQRQSEQRRMVHRGTAGQSDEAGKVSVKEAVADLLAESFFHPAAGKAAKKLQRLEEEEEAITEVRCT